MTTKTLLLTLITVFTVFTTAYAIESEPNNSRATANVLSLNAGDNGAINISGDEDWWSVTTTGDGKLDVTLTISNGLNLWCQIYDNDGTILLAQSYTAGTATVSRDGLAAGTYYIRLFPFYLGQLPVYTITNALTVPAQANDVEPNGSRAQAKVLPLNGSRTGHINYYYNNIKDTNDWYRVTTNADGRLRLTMTSANGQNVWAYLYDNDGTTLLAGSYTSGSAVVVNKDGLAAGTYYIRVNTFYSTEWAPYTLSDSLFVPTEPNDTEPNGTKEQALTLPLNGSVTGHNNYYYNQVKDTVDWYKVTTTADGRLRLTMTSGNGQNVWAYLYDNNGTTLLAQGYTSGSAAVVNKDGLAAGTYYIRVNTYYTSEWAPYTLSDSLFSPAQANDTEPNDSRAQAINLPLNGSKTGHTNYYYNNVKDTSDWYRLTTNADGMISITIQSHNGQNVWAYLYDNNGTTLIEAKYTTTSITYTVDGLSQGTYYLRIKTYYTTEWAPYTISNTLTTYTNGNDTEPNNNFTQAKTITANGTATGHVNFYYNNAKDAVDFYKINYTGTGNLTLVFNQQNRLKFGSVEATWFQVFKDTTAGPIYSQYHYATSGNINLTNLAQGYYYIKVFTYYNGNFADFSSYSITNTFTQVNIANLTVTGGTTASAICDSTGVIALKCGGSNAPYTVQLFRFGIPYGTTRVITNTNQFTYTNLPTGFYQARVYGDGASGNAFGTSIGISLMPQPTALTTTNIQATQARLSFTTFPACTDGYGVQYRKTGDSEWILDTAVKSPFNLKNLTPGTTYSWRVASGDTANGYTALSRYSDSLTFTTLSAGFATAEYSADNSTSAFSNPGKVSAYPNPARNQVTLQFGTGMQGKYTITIKDMNGRIMWINRNADAKVMNNISVSVANWPGGMYLLEITGKNNEPVTHQKIIVAH